MSRRTMLQVLSGLAACLLFVGCAPELYTVTSHLVKPIPVPTTIRIGSITDHLPPSVEEKDKPSAEEIQKLKKYLIMEIEDLSLNIVVEENDEAVYEIVGRLMEFKSGSRLARYFLGFGAGKAGIVSELKLIDVASGEVVFGGLFEGEVSIGAFGGSRESMFRQVASNFSKALQKQHISRGGKPLKTVSYESSADDFEDE